MDTGYYRDEAEYHLKDITFYHEITSNVDHLIKKKLNYLVSSIFLVEIKQLLWLT